MIVHERIVASAAMSEPIGLASRSATQGSTVSAGNPDFAIGVIKRIAINDIGSRGDDCQRGQEEGE